MEPILLPSLSGCMQGSYLGLMLCRGWFLLSSFRTQSLPGSMSGIGGYGHPSGCGMFVSSSWVNVDSYCLLSMFDLSSGSTCIFPFSLSGATPLLSFRRAWILDQNLFCFPGRCSQFSSPRSIKFSILPISLTLCFLKFGLHASVLANVHWTKPKLTREKSILNTDLPPPTFFSNLYVENTKHVWCKVLWVLMGPCEHGKGLSSVFKNTLIYHM